MRAAHRNGRLTSLSSGAAVPTWGAGVSGWPLQGSVPAGWAVGPGALVGSPTTTAYCVGGDMSHRPGVAAAAEGRGWTLAGKCMCPPWQVPTGARQSSALGQEFTQRSYMSFLETSSEKGRKDHEPGLLPRGSVDTDTRTTWGSLLSPGNQHLGWGWGSECGQHILSVIFLFTSSWTQLVLPALGLQGQHAGCCLVPCKSHFRKLHT